MFKRKLQLSDEMKEQLKVMHFKYSEKCLKQKNGILYDAIKRIDKRIQGDIRII